MTEHEELERIIQALKELAEQYRAEGDHFRDIYDDDAAGIMYSVASDLDNIRSSCDGGGTGRCRALPGELNHGGVERGRPQRKDTRMTRGTK